MNYELELKELVARYGMLKDEAKKLKPLIDEDGKTIKELMQASKKSEFSSGGYIAKISIRKSESFDENSLLMKVKALGLNHLIKTKKYVDMDDLEDSIYSGEIDAKELASCKTTSTTEMLTIKKEKVK